MSITPCGIAKFFPRVFVCVSKAFFGQFTDTWRTGQFHDLGHLGAVLLYAAKKAHRVVRCKANFQGNPALSHFLSQWAIHVASQIELQLLASHHYVFLVFLPALRAYNGHPPVGPGSSSAPPRPKKQKKADHAALVPQLLSHIQSMDEQRWLVVYTDAFAAKFPGGGGACGWVWWTYPCSGA